MQEGANRVKSVNDDLSKIPEESNRLSNDSRLKLPKRDFSNFRHHENLSEVDDCESKSQSAAFSIGKAYDEYFVSLRLNIIDNGIGISKEGLSNLFIDFSKLDENQERNKSGTGLGLSICKQLIEQIGGSVKVESDLGVGTSFQIYMNTECQV